MATFQGIAPIFPTADLDAMRAHYEALGFSVHVHGGGYGTAARDGVKIHFRHVPASAPGDRGSGGARCLHRRRRRRRAARRMASSGGG